TQDGVDDVCVLGSVALCALADPTSADVHAADLGGHGTDGGIDDVDEAVVVDVLDRDRVQTLTGGVLQVSTVGALVGHLSGQRRVGGIEVTIGFDRHLTLDLTTDDVQIGFLVHGDITLDGDRKSTRLN